MDAETTIRQLKPVNTPELWQEAAREFANLVVERGEVVAVAAHHLAAWEASLRGRYHLRAGDIPTAARRIA